MLSELSTIGWVYKTRGSYNSKVWVWGLFFIELIEDMGKNLVVVCCCVFHEIMTIHVNFRAPLFKQILNMIKIVKYCCWCIKTRGWLYGISVFWDFSLIMWKSWYCWWLLLKPCSNYLPCYWIRLYVEIHRSDYVKCDVWIDLWCFVILWEIGKLHGGCCLMIWSTWLNWWSYCYVEMSMILILMLLTCFGCGIELMKMGFWNDKIWMIQVHVI